MTPVDPVWLRTSLVDWFRTAARSLPWRDDPTPYHVLLSELMLQQTRVATVIPYFERFVARWPTVQDLASAPEAELLEAWAGLGYYRRARALHAAAKAATEAGGIPTTVDALRALPGVGPYTAGAVASIAHGLPVAAVDGNVERVISRVDGRHDNPRTAAGRRALAARVEEITAAGVASEVTQGLMELGATVCTPRQAKCSRCPWTARCVARQEGTVEQLPKLPPRRKPVPVAAVAVVVAREGQILLAQRPPGLLGGLWEPPSSPLTGTVAGEAAAIEALEAAIGCRPTALSKRGTLTHVFTHRRLTLEVYAAQVPADVALLRGDRYDDLGWFDAEDPGVGLSKLALKTLAAAQRGALPWAPEV